MTIPNCDQLSDATCTALQLANFWQDVTVDLQKDRVYLPLELFDRYGYSLSELMDLKCTPAFREVMREAVNMARGLFQQGSALPTKVDRRLGFDLELFSRGGLRVLEKIENLNYNVLIRRPAISKFERVQLLVSSVGTLLKVRT